MTGQQQWQQLGLGREPEPKPWLNLQEGLELVAVGLAQQLAVADKQHRYCYRCRKQA